MDRRLFLALIGGGVFAGAYHGMTAIRHARRQRQYQPQVRNGSGSELALVFIGSSTCWACGSPDLPRILERLKLALVQRARDHGCSFSAVGIAVDPHPEAGIRFLTKFGHFDEISCGGGMLGLGCRRYLQDIPGTAVVPQIVVVFRHVVVDRMGAAIRDEHAVLRKTGLEQLRDWIELGAPLPAFESSVDTSKPATTR
jgi:hypothetical protein